MKLSLLAQDFQRCSINPEIHSLPFDQWELIPKHIKGIYSIWENDHCIYVGKTGNAITKRMLHHHNKAYAIFEQGTRDTMGWRIGRNRPTWSPSSWTIEYFVCSSAVARTYLEGAIMLLYDPECNDENVEDRINYSIGI